MGLIITPPIMMLVKVGNYLKYELLVLDVDGTLVDSNGDISKKDIEAIQIARDRGVIVSLSTGRIPLACKWSLSKLQLDGFHIFIDGALVSDLDVKAVVRTQPIDRETVLEAVEFARSNKIYMEMYTIDKFYAEQANWTDEIHKNFFGACITLDDIEKVGKKYEILKMETIARYPEEYEKAELLKKKFSGKLRFSIARSPAFPGVDFVNIIEPVVSKGNALKQLANHFKTPLEKVVAVGDGLNDLSLLSDAGLGIAMDNAFDEVKAVADVITGSVDNGGVAEVIQNYFL